MFKPIQSVSSYSIIRWEHSQFCPYILLPRLSSSFLWRLQIRNFSVGGLQILHTTSKPGGLGFSVRAYSSGWAGFTMPEDPPCPIIFQAELCSRNLIRILVECKMDLYMLIHHTWSFVMADSCIVRSMLAIHSSSRSGNLNSCLHMPLGNNTIYWLFNSIASVAEITQH